MNSRRSIAIFLCASFSCGGISRAQSVADFEQPPIKYSETTPQVFSALQARIASGDFRFSGSEQNALKTLLAAVDVPVESQLLVFSKTSLQRRRISPERPRALYFSDSVYVGWVPGGVAEVVLIDPALGPVFYSFDLHALQNGRPKIERETNCLDCHGGTFVRDIPGIIARSVFADDGGEPLLRHGTLVVDDETPFADRWGGWYVTGYHGTESHRGNVFASEKGEALAFTPSAKRPDTLEKYFETGDYLAATSDVVALLVFEHQLTMHNALTRANFAIRRMIAYQHGLQKAFKEPLTDEPAYDSVKNVFTRTTEDVVDRLLFRNAANLPEGVFGDEAFQEQFTKNAPRAGGHSLKDLQLSNRIFANRCSFLIYSPQFLGLPEGLKSRIFARLDQALRSRDPEDRYAYLSEIEKQRIQDILWQTHPDAKRFWHKAPGLAVTTPSEMSVALADPHR
jgi:hypothetical protein